MGTFWGRLDKVKDPKTAFFYLLDNVAGKNNGKYLSSQSSRGDYHWVERDRETDQSYFIVKRHGDYILVKRRQWVVNGVGVNTFMGSIVGFDEQPVVRDTIVLRHPVMAVETFLDEYNKACPTLEVWMDLE